MALSNSLSYNVTMKKSIEIIGKNRKALNLCLIIANLAILAILGFVLFQRHNTKSEQVAKAEKKMCIRDRPQDNLEFLGVYSQFSSFSKRR